jgi:hypothetical protein
MKKQSIRERERERERERDDLWNYKYVPIFSTMHRLRDFIFIASTFKFYALEGNPFDFERERVSELS